MPIRTVWPVNAPSPADHGPSLLPLPVRVLLAAVAVGTMGLLSWVPGLVGAALASEPRRRLRMVQSLGLTAVLALVGALALGATSAEAQDATIVDDLGVIALLAAMGVGGCTAFFVGGRRSASPTTALPGVQQGLARRQLRQQYQALAGQDPALAVELGVGRPDCPGRTDDGGLLDLNTLDAAALQRFARLSAAEAQQVLAARERLGRLSGVEDLVVHSELDPHVAERLREYAVFLY